MKRILSKAIAFFLVLVFAISVTAHFGRIEGCGLVVLASTLDSNNAQCRTSGHLWCGVAGDFVQRPGPGVWTDHAWWYEICGRSGCDFALPLADIYLQLLEPGRIGHATGKVWDGKGAKSWSEVPDDVKDRLIHTFNVRWKDIVDWMDFGIVSRVEYVLDSEGIAWASGRRAGLSLTWILENPWDTDCMTHELVHCAQRYSNVPTWVHEGMADYARAKFGLFNKEAGRMLRPSGRDAKDPSTDPNSGFVSGYVAGYNRTATFYQWIEENHNPNFVQELNYSLKANLVTNFQEDVLSALQTTTGVRGIKNSNGQGKYHLDGRQFAQLTGNDVKPTALTGNRSTVVNALWAGYMESHLNAANATKAA